MQRGLRMTQSRHPQQIASLSKEDIQKSRIGALGRFPAPDLYEPEEETLSDSSAQPTLKSRVKVHGESRD